MMIGKSENVSDSFVNFKLNVPNEKNGEQAHVNRALRGKTIGERNEEALAGKQKNAFGTDAYTVDISDHGKQALAFASGSVVNLSVGIGVTREEELAALEDSIRSYQKMNETFQRIGVPIDPREEQERMASIAARAEQGALDLPQTAEGSGLRVSEQNMGEILKAATGLEGRPFNQTTYTPVTEIRSRHYKWTEEKGIEEILSKEAELEQTQNVLRGWIAEDINKTIENILQPYETYEEAYDHLHARNELGWNYSIQEDTMSIEMKGTNVQGTFGTLANQLNNYLEQFGKDDSYFNRLHGALNELDPGGTSALVQQIHDMINTVQRGGTIETESRDFQEDVEEAIAAVYGGGGKKKTDARQKKEEKPEQEEAQGLSFLEMQRRAAEQEGRLLDELLGREHDRSVESAGDILAKRKPEAEDTEFTDRLRRVDEREEPRQPLTFERKNTEGHTRLSEEEITRQKALYDAWMKIGPKLTAEGNSATTVDETPNRVDLLA